jgi:CO dehydrogenase/acetyl-CoA synthase alpha subunit
MEDPLDKEAEKLRAMIKQQEDERIAREEAIVAEAKAKKLQAEQEALKAKKIAAASTAAKQAAEKAAEDIAKIVKAESDKKLAESEAARMELEKRLEQQQKEHTKREHAIMTEYQAALRKMEAGQGV